MHRHMNQSGNARFHWHRTLGAPSDIKAAARSLTRLISQPERIPNLSQKPKSSGLSVSRRLLDPNSKPFEPGTRMLPVNRHGSVRYVRSPDVMKCAGLRLRLHFFAQFGINLWKCDLVPNAILAKRTRPRTGTILIVSQKSENQDRTSRHDILW
jgi:hypothetical protein